MFYSSLGIALLMKEELSESYRYLRKSLELGEKAISQTVIGHTCFRLAHTCANLDQLDEAVSFGERARSLSKNPDAELPLHRVAVGLGIAYWYRGDIRKLRELGEELIDEGNNNLDLRHQAMANMVIGLSHLCAGNYKLAIQNFKAMIKESFDPLPIQISNSMLGLAYLGDGQYQKALTVSEKVIRFSEKYGFEIIGTTITALSGYALAATGNLNSGLRILANLEKVWNKTNMRYKLALYNLFYGQLYLQIVEGKGPKSFSFIIKNFWSLIRLVPGAATKSEIHFKKAIEIASDIGAKGILAQAYLGLGLLHRVKEKLEKARKNLMIATQIFEKIEAEGFLKTSNSALESLG
jgi:tetratricopeptide (TPR) repeat protein